MTNPEEKTVLPIFEWAENSVQDALIKLRLGETEGNGKLKIVEIMDEIDNSALFWAMNSRYDDAIAACNGDQQLEHVQLRAFIARAFIAGSLRRCPVIRDV